MSCIFKRRVSTEKVCVLELETWTTAGWWMVLGNDALTSQIFHRFHSRSSNTSCISRTICLPPRVLCFIRWFALTHSSARYPGCFLGNACRTRQEEMWFIHTRKSSGRVQTDEEPMRISVWHKQCYGRRAHVDSCGVVLLHCSTRVAYQTVLQQIF